MNTIKYQKSVGAININSQIIDRLTVFTPQHKFTTQKIVSAHRYTQLGLSKGGIWSNIEKCRLIHC